MSEKNNHKTYFYILREKEDGKIVVKESAPFEGYVEESLVKEEDRKALEEYLANPLANRQSSNAERKQAYAGPKEKRHMGLSSEGYVEESLVKEEDRKALEEYIANPLANSQPSNAERKQAYAGPKEKRHMGLSSARTFSNTIVYVILVVMTVIWLVPFVFLVLQSFRIESTGIVGYVVPEQWGIDNYIRLFQNTKFPKWFLNTFLISLATAALQTIIVLCMSYTLSRIRFVGRKFLMNFMLVLGMFPGMLTMIILYRVLADLGMTKQHSVPGLILVYAASSGMGYYISKGFFDTLPKSLDEAARVDGATRAQVLLKVILPLSKPIVIYTLLTAFMGPWGDFVFASYISNNASDGMNVAVGLQNMLSTSALQGKNYTMFCAGGVIVAIPITVLFLFLQKYYVEGVTGGAVKG